MPKKSVKSKVKKHFKKAARFAKKAATKYMDAAANRGIVAGVRIADKEVQHKLGAGYGAMKMAHVFGQNLGYLPSSTYIKEFIAV